MTDTQIDKGIRVAVQKLRDAGYVTTDSGDGTNHGAGMKCALPYRHVFGRLDEGDDMRWVANSLQGLFPNARIEVSYSPREPAVFCVFPDGHPDGQ